MTRQDHEGVCDHCGKTFAYHLVHNGFNESCYAYCSSCGMTAVIDTGYEDRKGLPRHRAITEGAEDLLSPCSCGGTFRPGASPRCPHCQQTLSAEKAAEWIEEDAPGAVKGWRWQRNWDGLYAIVIDRRSVRNPFLPVPPVGPSA